MTENMKPADKPERRPVPGLMTGKKSIIAIGCGIAVALAILTFSNWVTTPNRDNPDFSYWTEGNRDKPVDVTDNRRVEVPITFVIDRGIPEVILEFSGEHAQLSGVSLLTNSVKVIDGKASSKIIIQFDEKPTINAGTHYLTILAKDPETDRIIREGRIQFNYNMHEVIGKCSC